MSEIRKIIIRPIKPLGQRLLRIDTKTFTSDGKVIYIADNGKVQTVSRDEFNKGKNILTPMPTIMINEDNPQYVIEIDESLGELSKNLLNQLKEFWYKHHNIKEFTGSIPNENLKSNYEFELVDENVYDETCLQEDSAILESRNTFMAMDEIKQKQAAILCGIGVLNKRHQKVVREMASLKSGFICRSKRNAEEFMGHLDVLSDKVIVNTYFAIESKILVEHQGVFTYVGQTIGRTKGECALFMKNNPSIYNQMVRDTRAKSPEINLEGEQKEEKPKQNKAEKGKEIKVLEELE